MIRPLKFRQDLPAQARFFEHAAASRRLSFRENPR